jgi:hypothetical protein
MNKIFSMIKNILFTNVNLTKKNNIILMGRWYLEKEQVKVNIKIDYANIDNCYSNNKIN